MSKKVVIIGGHGKVSLRLSKLLTHSSPTHSVKSVIRNPDQVEVIRKTLATPVILSLEDDPVSKFSELFEGQDAVYFSAGAGGTPEVDRIKRVDYDGALKVFDAIEEVKGPKPRLILVSAIDVRNLEVIPAHYTKEDIELSKYIWGLIPDYMRFKYEADKNLVSRTAFKWTILRPGQLSDELGKNKASIGRTGLKGQISRDDVAQVLFLLLEREDAAGLAIDLVGGESPISEALDTAIKRGETDFLG